MNTRRHRAIARCGTRGRRCRQGLPRPHDIFGPAPARGRIPSRDATLGEDADRVRARHAPVNNATRNKIAPAIVRRRGFRFVPAATTHAKDAGAVSGPAPHEQAGVRPFRWAPEERMFQPRPAPTCASGAPCRSQRETTLRTPAQL